MKKWVALMVIVGLVLGGCALVAESSGQSASENTIGDSLSGSPALVTSGNESINFTEKTYYIGIR